MIDFDENLILSSGDNTDSLNLNEFGGHKKVKKDQQLVA